MRWTEDPPGEAVHATLDSSKTAGERTATRPMGPNSVHVGPCEWSSARDWSTWTEVLKCAAKPLGPTRLTRAPHL